jgi:hypothetical protein
MKRLVIIFAVFLSAIVGWAAYQEVAKPAQHELAGLMPQDALIFIEAKDFGSILRQWNSSPQQQLWLKSDNHEAFSRSHLFLRLSQAQEEFASAAGVSPDNAFLNEVAGERSALGVYDIGKLELLYITHLPSAKAMNSALWQQRGHFESRESAGHKFYVRTDAKSERMVAFAVEDDYMILGTREDLVAGALTLLADQKASALSQQAWLVDALKMAHRDAGDMRMAIHLAAVVKTPQFRTYWIQRNVTEMKGYESSVSDLYLSSTTYREERSLTLKNSEGAAPEDGTQVAELMRLVPAEIGFYRAVASPPLEDSLALLEQGVLMPQRGPEPESKVAPPAAAGAQDAGSAANLEERIDVPPAVSTIDKSGDEALRALLKTANVRAGLQLNRSETASDGVFVHLYSTMILVGAADWSEEAAQRAVQRLLAPGITAANLGIGWRRAGGKDSYLELDGLSHIALAVRGKYLFIGNDPQTIAAALSHLADKSSASPALYCAGFDHNRERQNFYRLTSLVDRPSRNGNNNPDGEPEFFSQNAASFSKSMAAVKSQSIVVTRDGGLERQTVTYQWQ